MPHAHPSRFPSPSSAHSNAGGGQAPALRFAMPSSFTVGRGPVPRRASVQNGKRLWAAGGFRADRRSRGTGPRATVCNAVFFHRRARACPSPCLGSERETALGGGWFSRRSTLAGDRPPRYDEKTARHRRARALGCHTRIRAGFPRHRPRTPTRAGDRPPRYGKIETGRSLLPGKLMSISVPRESLLMPGSSPGSSW